MKAKISDVMCSQCDQNLKLCKGDAFQIIQEGLDLLEVDCPNCNGSNQIYIESMEMKLMSIPDGQRVEMIEKEEEKILGSFSIMPSLNKRILKLYFNREQTREKAISLLKKMGGEVT